MIRNSSRRLLSWRYLRWAIALPALPMVWWACISHPLTQPTPEPEQQTNLYITVAPVRKLDLLFMVDNSPSMAPKVKKMNDNFKLLIGALKDPNDGTYPDLRVALIDSDLGTGGAYDSGFCGPNDSNGHQVLGDLGNFQMRGAGGCGVNDSSALWLQSPSGAQDPAEPNPLNFNGDINNVFACLATNLGTVGCGEEHQLQAFEFAFYLAAKDRPAQYANQSNFLRPDAYLGLVFLSDEDDCSAYPNDMMFGNLSDLANESPSLRCSTRGHQCKINGNMANLTDNGPHYPTDTAFTANFADCASRTDYCDPNDKSIDYSKKTSCTPLRSTTAMANEYKSLKAADKLLVAGIFGWPRKGADGKPDFTNAKYRVDKTPNPTTTDTAHPQIWDYWPVCYDPNHMPKDSTSYDADAWGNGAEGGLRMSAFLDEFGDNGLKYSICEPDFTDAMGGIGAAIAKKLQNLCVDAKLYDTDLNPNNQSLADVAADCRVVYRHQILNGKTVTYQEDQTPLPKCDPGATTGKVSQDCWTLTIDKKKCTVNGQLIQIIRTTTDPLPAGTMVGMQCRSCPNDISKLPTESDTYKACSYTPF